MSSRMNVGRRLFGLIVVASGLWAHARVEAGPMMTLQFDSGPIVMMNGQQINFAAQHIAGSNYDVSAGKLVLVLVPGANAGSFLSASLTFTGVDAAHPFMVTYDGNTPGASNSVFINVSASGFDVLNHPVPETASLDGTIASAGPLAIGVELVGRANAVPVTDVKPANAKGPGAFNGADNKNTPFNGVSSISGVFTFTWDPAKNAAADHVDLPDSANVTVYGDGSPLPTPEPSTLLTSGVAGLVGLAVAHRKSRRQRLAVV